jgi:hypothetical protein
MTKQPIPDHIVTRIGQGFSYDDTDRPGPPSFQQWHVPAGVARAPLERTEEG